MNIVRINSNYAINLFSFLQLRQKYIQKNKTSCLLRKNLHINVSDTDIRC